MSSRRHLPIGIHIFSTIGCLEISLALIGEYGICSYDGYYFGRGKKTMIKLKSYLLGLLESCLNHSVLMNSLYMYIKLTSQNNHLQEQQNYL